MSSTHIEVGARPSTGQSDRASAFAGVLYATRLIDPEAEISEPDYFGDLNLDQVEAAVTAGREHYKLTPYFRALVRDVDAVWYRQDVFRDLEQDPVREHFDGFADQMSTMRKTVGHAGKLRDDQPKRRWFLNAVEGYCRAVTDLTAGLTAAELRSDALAGLRDYLTRYVAGKPFEELRAQAAALIGEFGAVRYDLLMRATKLTVGPYDDEADYSAEVLATFERFRQGEVKDHHAKTPASGDMNHVEVAILDMVARLYPELFGRLAQFCEQHDRFVDPTIARADRELQFYLAYLTYVAPLRKAGLAVSYPRLSSTSKSIVAADTFDIALATKLTREGGTVVSNEFHLDGPERILVVSGPNNGGKTTMARTFGQLFHLAALGCPVPGSDVRLFLPDQIFTHFERQEDIETLAGKLEDELNRMHSILTAATADSVIVLNEIFNSTTVQDAAELSQRVLSIVSDLDALSVCVTFIDELSTLNEKTVSMVSTVDPDDPAVRTFRLVPKPADGRAYALAIAQKYRLTYDTLKGRLG